MDHPAPKTSQSHRSEHGSKYLVPKARSLIVCQAVEDQPLVSLCITFIQADLWRRRYIIHLPVPADEYNFFIFRIQLMLGDLFGLIFPILDEEANLLFKILQ